MGGGASDGGWVSTVALPAFGPLHAQFVAGGFEAVDTQAFTEACAQLTGVFDRLGMCMQIASQDVNEKKAHLLQEAVLARSPKVADLITNDAKEDKVCLPGEDSRMMHCMKRMLHFVSHLMESLVNDPKVSLYDAASNTYKTTLAKYHATAVQYVIAGGLWLLPNRVKFLETINETEETLQQATTKWLELVKPMLEALDKVYEPYESRCVK